MVGLLLYGLYWLTTSGAFHSIDEHAVFAVSRALLYEGRWDQSALFWREPYLEQAQIGLDGALYSKYGIGHSLLLLPAMALARLLPGATLGSATTLVNLVATALTGAFMVAMVRELGYLRRTAVGVGLLFGVATLAWPYARTTFSEPIVGCLWSGAAWLLVTFPTVRGTVGAGLMVAAAIAVRPASLLFTPLFALPLLAIPARRTVTQLLALLLPVAVVVTGLLAFNQLRFGDPLQFGYSEQFNGSLLAGLVGFLFSLDRSLFLFCPPLLALFGSVVPFMRRAPVWGLTFLALGVATLLAYSLWPVFWGGPVWGPRYLLPALPLLCVLLAPAVEAAWNGERAARFLIPLLAVAGILMQLRGLLWNSLPQTQTLGQRAALWLLPPRADEWDLAWRLLPGGAGVALLLLALALVTLRGNRAAALAACAALLLTPLLLALLGRATPGIVPRPTYPALLQEARSLPRSTALLLNPAPYQEPIAELIWFLDQPSLDVPTYGLYRLPPEQAESQLPQVDWLLTQHPAFELVTSGVAPGDPASTTERLLAARAVSAGSDWLDGTTRLARFEAAQPATARGTPGAVLGETARLEQWAIAWSPATAGGLQVTLEWVFLRPTTANLHTFVQLLDADGRLVSGWDAEPQAGVAPAPTWRADQPITERVLLTIPADHPPAALTLIAGLYDPATGQRLATAEGWDAITLAPVPWPSR